MTVSTITIESSTLGDRTYLAHDGHGSQRRRAAAGARAAVQVTEPVLLAASPS